MSTAEYVGATCVLIPPCGCRIVDGVLVDRQPGCSEPHGPPPSVDNRPLPVEVRPGAVTALVEDMAALRRALGVAADAPTEEMVMAALLVREENARIVRRDDALCRHVKEWQDASARRGAEVRNLTALLERFGQRILDAVGHIAVPASRCSDVDVVEEAVKHRLAELKREHKDAVENASLWHQATEGSDAAYSKVKAERDAFAGAIHELQIALAPFARFRVDKTAATDGPDLIKTVAIVERRHGVTQVIQSRVYDVVIHAAIVYAARRAMQKAHWITNGEP